MMSMAQHQFSSPFIGEQLSVYSYCSWVRSLLCTGKAKCLYRMHSFILSKQQFYPEEERGRWVQNLSIGCFVLENNVNHV